MTIKYGILPFDEPKEFKTGIEVPKKLVDFNCNDESDFRSVAPTFMEKVLETANSEKFRFYAEYGEAKVSYQVNLSKENRAFFESELLDDLMTLKGRKSFNK